jgi:hypothetical protein
MLANCLALRRADSVIVAPINRERGNGVPMSGARRPIVVRINRLHPFYETLYADLLKLEGGTRAKEAVDVLLLALGKGELTVDDEVAKMWYERQRTARWSPSLADALKILAQTLRPTEEPEEGN